MKKSILMLLSMVAFTLITCQKEDPMVLNEIEPSLMKSLAPPDEMIKNVVYGPEQFVRTKGQPNVYEVSLSSADFECILPPYVLTVINGEDDGSNRVTSGSIFLDGEMLFKPSDFKQKVDKLEHEVEINSQSNLTIMLASKPGSFIRIHITGGTEEYWEHTYVGLGDDIARSFIGTNDGGYIFVGHTNTPWPAPYDPHTWIVKLTRCGTIEWQKKYDPSIAGNDEIIQTHDGGFVVTGHNGTTKLDKKGIIEWSAPMGGTSIIQTSDLNYLTFDHLGLTMLSQNGNHIWSKEIPNFQGSCLLEDKVMSGEYILGGSYKGIYGVSKVDKEGNVLWQQNFSEYVEISLNAMPSAVIQDKNGYFYFSGIYFYTCKIDGKGNLEWFKVTGGGDLGNIWSIVPSQNGFILAGNRSYGTSWIVEIDKDGNEIKDQYIRPLSDIKGIVRISENDYVIGGLIANPTHYWLKKIKF